MGREIIDKIDKDKKKQSKRLIRISATIAAVVIIVVIALLILPGLGGKKASADTGAATFEVKRSDLTISVTETGDIMALNFVDIKSKVEGRTTIINIVDEGTYLTAEDVNNGKVLVELDSSNIKDKLTQQRITYLKAEASYTEAKEALDIQKKQNDSDIQAGEMKVRFGMIDLQKYLGSNVADKLISMLERKSIEQQNIGKLIDDSDLGGEALQKLRQLKADIAIAEAKLALAVDTLEGTKKLFEKNYVAEVELKGDELEKESLQIQKERAETSLELFRLYEFGKEAEKLLSDYHEAKLELERIKARARSRLAQAEAQHGSSEATFIVQKEQKEKFERQLEACIIKAPSPGEVVYASSTDRRGRWGGSNNPIEIGTEIHERQKIISIPDTSTMKVEVNIHETWIDKIQPKQRAKITVAAFPDETFEGTVLKKAPLAAPENWMSPDLKVYATDVLIEGTHEYLKTGMSAKVEIIVEELSDILIVPIQTVSARDGKKVCFVQRAGGAEKVEVETGAFNDSYVQITKGLTEGEKVLLNPPRAGQDI